MDKIQYDYIEYTVHNQFFSSRMDKFQSQGWEVCGSITPYIGNGSGGKDIFLSIPLRREKKADNG